VCACEVPFSITSVVCCQIHFWQVQFSFFCTMDVVLMKKVELLVVDDLHFGIRNKYGTFD